MIWWVYKNALKVKELDKLFVATDDERISAVCKKFNLEHIMTSNYHKTGTDRIAEVATKIKSKYYVNIQGDEPLVSPETIRSAILKDGDVVSLMTKIKRKDDISDFSVPKVVVDINKNALFLSRFGIPYHKGKESKYYKQVCVYKFSAERLKDFSMMKRGPVEQSEDIEILRFLENGMSVIMEEVLQDTISVDTPDDLKLVINKMMEKNV